MTRLFVLKLLTTLSVEIAKIYVINVHKLNAWAWAYVATGEGHWPPLKPLL